MDTLDFIHECSVILNIWGWVRDVAPHTGQTTSNVLVKARGEGQLLPPLNTADCLIVEKHVISICSVL